VNGVADPPGPRPGWRRPAAVQRLARHLPVSEVDIVVATEVLLAIVVFAGTNSVLLSANQRGRHAGGRR
jgi:hypothetical protein